MGGVDQVPDVADHDSDVLQIPDECSLQGQEPDAGAPTGGRS